MPEAAGQTTLDAISRRAAEAVLSQRGLRREAGEDPLSALGWAQGAQLSHEDAFLAFAKSLVEELGVLDLVEAKLELLSEHKLDYPQDYEPEDLAAIHAEIERLEALSAALV